MFRCQRRGQTPDETSASDGHEDIQRYVELFAEFEADRPGSCHDVGEVVGVKLQCPGLFRHHRSRFGTERVPVTYLVDVGTEGVQARNLHRRSSGRHHDSAPQAEHPARRRGTDGGVTARGDDNTGVGEPTAFVRVHDRIQTAADLERSTEL